MLLIINLFAIEFIYIQYLCIIGHDQISRTDIDHLVNFACKLDFVFAMCEFLHMDKYRIMGEYA